jgi:hypothetical protein
MNADSATLRPRIYALLITLAAGTVAGRLLSAESVLEPSLHRNANEAPDGRRVWPRNRPLPLPTFGGNDRSRWATVRNLVEKGTYVIGRRDRAVFLTSAVSLLGANNGPEAAALLATGYYLRTRSDTGLVTEEGWQTLDKVLHPGKLEYYSSKPPLLATLVAGLYWVVYHLGWTFANDPWTVVRVLLFLINFVPLMLYLGLLARLLERYGTTDWGKLYVLAAGCFATLLTAFAITLNNHTVATCSALFALYPALGILDATTRPGRARNVKPPGYLFALAGFFAAFTACNELPATAFLVFLGLWLLVRAPGQTLAFFVPAAAIPIAAFLLTNYLAIGQLQPAYGELGGVWYEYEGSYWREPLAGEQRRGIDWAHLNETRAEYALHVLVGHHGIFSLTPIWLLAIAAMVAGVGRLLAGSAGPPVKNQDVARPQEHASLWQPCVSPRSGLTLVTLLTLLLTVVVIGFYLIKSNNYGGWTNGLRWLMWLSPFWLLTMLPVADRLGTTLLGRAVACVLLAISVLSVNYSMWNPWRHPWLYHFMQEQGWIHY